MRVRGSTPKAWEHLLNNPCATMGNCNSSASHRRAAADTLAGDLLWKDRSTTEYMDFQNESDEHTLPLSSPGTTIQSGTSPMLVTPSQLTTRMFDVHDNLPVTPSPMREEGPLPATSSPVYTPNRLPETEPPANKPSPPRSTSGPSRPGKALQHRLEKARCVQTVLSQSMTVTEDEESLDECLSPKDSSITLAASTTNKPLTKPSNLLSTTNKSLNDEFDASLSQGMVWAEADMGDEVESIAISRRQATEDSFTPTLYMAVGTKSGKIIIYELAEDTPLCPSSPPKNVSTDDEDGDDDVSLGLDDLMQVQHTSTQHPPLRRRLRAAVDIQHASGRIRSMDFSPDGLFLAVGGDDCSCSLYVLVYESDDEADFDDMLVDAELCGEMQRVDRVYCVQFSPDGRYLAVGGFDGTVAIFLKDELWNTHVPDAVVEISRDGLIFTLDWSPDSRFLAIGGSDKCCAIVDTHTSWNVMRELRRSSTVTDVKWYPTSGAYLAIASNNIAIVDRGAFTLRHEFTFADLSTKSSDRPCNGKVNQMCWSPNGTYLVACDSGSRCTLFEAKSFMPVYEITRSKAINALVWGEQSTTSGTPRRYLAIGGDDERVIVVKAGLELNNHSFMDDNMSTSSNSLLSQRSEWTLKESAFRDVDDVSHQMLRAEVDCDESGDLNVSALAFSRGSKSRPSTFLAYCLDDGLVVVRSTIDFRVIAELRFSKPMKSLAFSNGSRFLAMGGVDGRVFVVETVPMWSVVAQLDFDSPIQNLAYSKHNERLSIGLQDGRLALLDPQTGYNIAGEIAASSSCISAVDWTSKYFALGRLDGTVAVYDCDEVKTSTGPSPITVLQQGSPVKSICFGASGRFLAVGGSDGHVNIYSSKGGWIRCHSVNAPPGMQSLAWSATGRYLAVAGDQYLRVVETIFWTDFQEVTDALFPSDLSQTMSRLAFGQDESMLAVAVNGNGIRILDCRRWKLLFMMNRAETNRSDEPSGGTEYDTH